MPGRRPGSMRAALDLPKNPIVKGLAHSGGRWPDRLARRRLGRSI